MMLKTDMNADKKNGMYTALTPELCEEISQLLVTGSRLEVWDKLQMRFDERLGFHNEHDDSDELQAQKIAAHKKFVDDVLAALKLGLITPKMRDPKLDKKPVFLGKKHGPFEPTRQRLERHRRRIEADRALRNSPEWQREVARRKAEEARQRAEFEAEDAEFRRRMAADGPWTEEDERLEMLEDAKKPTPPNMQRYLNNDRRHRRVREHFDAVWPNPEN